MDNLKKSNDLLEAIVNGTAFDPETGMIWQHWLEEISKQVDINNIELSAVANDSKDESNCNLPHVSGALPYDAPNEIWVNVYNPIKPNSWDIHDSEKSTVMNSIGAKTHRYIHEKFLRQ